MNLKDKDKDKLKLRDKVQDKDKDKDKSWDKHSVTTHCFFAEGKNKRIENVDVFR